jgi:CBS domain-containing protein
MLVSEVMTRGVVCVSPETTLQEAARKMKSLDVGPLPVCDDDRLAGMITDRDIAVRAVAEGRDPNATRVGEVMTPEVVYCFEDEELEEAVRLMQEKQVRRLVVLDRDRRLCGIVSLGDVAVSTGDQRLAGKTLESVSQ